MTAAARYPVQVMDAMFDAVEMNDVVDPTVSLPDPIPIACDREAMRRCLDLCVQFWREGAVRADLLPLIATLMLTGDLPQDARIRYKHIRARYKQMRFALVLYGARHRVPLLFRATVALMGHLQDAFRGRRRSAAMGYAILLRALLTWPAWCWVQREVDRVQLDGADGFLRYRSDEVGRLRRWLADSGLTAHRFHAMRKIVSRQVSFYDTMRTLQPDDTKFRMSRFLSAINGLMGSLHDQLVEQAAAGRQNYHRDEFALPPDIRERLLALTEAYPRI